MPSKVIHYVDLNIASGASLSASTDISNLVVVSVIVPGTWTAASMTFAAADQRGGNKGVTLAFEPVYDDTGTEVSISATALGTGTRFVTFRNSDTMAGVALVKVRSGTSGTPVTQSQATPITLVCREQ